MKTQTCVLMQTETSHVKQFIFSQEYDPFLFLIKYFEPKSYTAMITSSKRWRIWIWSLGLRPFCLMLMPVFSLHVPVSLQVLKTATLSFVWIRERVVHLYVTPCRYPGFLSPDACTVDWLESVNCRCVWICGAWRCDGMSDEDGDEIQTDWLMRWLMMYSTWSLGM